ncbi:MAG: asparaginase, partial [Pygmaiobacter sp.]
FDSLLELHYRGVVLEAFGAGGLQFIRRDLSPQIRRLVENGIAVVVCSQCLYEGSDFSIYEVGRRVLDTGVIQSRDMTTEAAVTKLMWALGQTESLDEVRRIFSADFAGEITP